MLVVRPVRSVVYAAISASVFGLLAGGVEDSFVKGGSPYAAESGRPRKGKQPVASAPPVGRSGRLAGPETHGSPGCP